MIEVFRTNIESETQAYWVIRQLRSSLADTRVTIDLEDCDRVLRIEGPAFQQEAIIETIRKIGYECALLLD